jgi:hypothetical protein
MTSPVSANLDLMNAPLFVGFFGMFPLLLIAGGLALWAYSPFHRSKVEARLHDGEMSGAQARLHRTFLRIAAPTLTVLGCLQVALKLIELSQP